MATLQLGLCAILLHPMLSNLRIVLIETSEPGNIGGVARAMKNMCLQNLVLVNPAKFPHAKATARASGADDILAKALVCTSLDQAIEGCGVVMGASARLRRLTWPQLDPRQCAVKALANAQSTQVALVFGREHSGLTNEELERCQYLVHIPSNKEYSSLNLAAAVQVLSYELLMATINDDSTSGESQELPAEERPATAEEVEGFHAHLFEVLTQIGFLNQEHPRKMKRRLRRLFHKAHLDKVETNILRGILSTIQKNL